MSEENKIMKKQRAKRLENKKTKIEKTTDQKCKKLVIKKNRDDFLTHFIELVYTADAIVSEHQSSSLHTELS